MCAKTNIRLSVCAMLDDSGRMQRCAGQLLVINRSITGRNYPGQPGRSVILCMGTTALGGSVEP